MTNSIEFTGFVSQFPNEREFSYWKFMPLKNRLEDDSQDLKKFCNCIQDLIDIGLLNIDHITDQYDVDTCSDESIDHILNDLGNPFDPVEYEMSPSTKRKLVELLVPIYKSKGTDYGIEKTVLAVLGKTVKVVPFIKDTWILGRSKLGSRRSAKVFLNFGNVIDFSIFPEPRLWTFKINGESPVTADFSDSNFENVSDVKISEIVSVIENSSEDIEIETFSNSTGAFAIGTNSEPFALSGGDNFSFRMNGKDYEIVFSDSDFLVQNEASFDEVVKAIEERTSLFSADIFPLYPGVTNGLRIRSVFEDSSGSFNLLGGNALVVLGLQPGVYESFSSEKISVRTKFPGVDSMIETVNSNNQFVFHGLKLDKFSSAGTGGTILGPSSLREKITFDIETNTKVDSKTEKLIRKITDVMKFAPTHLNRIRTRKEYVKKITWVLGKSRLGVDSILSK